MSTRISTYQVYHNSTQHVTNAREKQTISSDRASSQKQINKPSDDPRGWILSNAIKDDLSSRDVMEKNGEMAMHVLNATDTMLAQFQDLCTRAYELSIDTVGSSTSDQKRDLVLGEVKNLFDLMVQTLNTRFGNRSLLSGYKTDTSAFDAQANFLGDNGVIQLEINRDVYLPLNLQASSVVFGEGVKNGIHIPELFKTLIAGLQTKDSELINDAVGGFVKGIDQISLARGEIGGFMNNLDRSVASLKAIAIDSKDAISKIEDVDAVKAFTDLSRDQAILNSALTTTRKILTETPTDSILKDR